MVLTSGIKELTSLSTLRMMSSTLSDDLNTSSAVDFSITTNSFAISYVPYVRIPHY
ncbi:hypothetical protein ABN080_11130 [Proteus sp. fly-1089]|uniref:hypothetical protein n=1 Tax=Proteus sp. fly-1089 TaxID=3136675 RepID=UPI0032DABFEF